MSGKTGKRITGRKPTDSNRMSALAAGAFGRESPENVRVPEETNVDRSGGSNRNKAKTKKPTVKNEFLDDITPA